MLTGIYQIVCKTTGKRYIGSTWAAHGFEGRWHRHRRELRAGKHGTSHLQRAWNKYGEGAFHWGILDVIEGKDACLVMEQIYFDTCDKDTLMNTNYKAAGGNGGANAGRTLTAEHIEKLRAAKKGCVSPNKGKPAWNKGTKGPPSPFKGIKKLEPAITKGVPKSPAAIAASVEGKRLAKLLRQKENN